MLNFFGERLEKVIKELGFKSHNKFAEGIGEQQGKVSRYVRGEGKPNFEFLEKLAITFPELNMRYLLNGQGSILGRDQEVGIDTEVIDVQKEEIESLQKMNEVQTKKATMFEQELLRLKKVYKKQNKQVEELTEQLQQAHKQIIELTQKIEGLEEK